jgi:hypothetical protein
MEMWQAVFRNFYTGFLLRDFVGKIIPGLFFLFSVCTIYYEPKKLFQFVTKDLPVYTIIFLAGFSWTITLGTQSLADGLGIWHYFPEDPKEASQPTVKIPFWRNLLGRGDDSAFDKDTLDVDEFQSKATEDEEQQYERFVVIKEACGNLFISILFSIPAWLFGYISRRPSPKAKIHSQPRLTVTSAILGALYVVVILIGLHRMQAQHVHRQYQFAKDLVDKHKNLPSKVQAAQPSLSDGKDKTPSFAK